jgi:hypothetical protein
MYIPRSEAWSFQAGVTIIKGREEMTRKLIIVVGAGCILVVNFLFVVFTVIASELRERRDRAR